MAASFYALMLVSISFCYIDCIPLKYLPKNVDLSRIQDGRSKQKADPEENMNASQLITSKGYPCEEHDVVTSDGYILTVQRIPYGRGQKPGPRDVVFLQHGLLGSASNFLTNLANESLAYILADHGYDVWLGNVRGCTYGRRHKTLSPKDKKFWDFSWDEMALLDLPAMISYALSVSGQKQLDYFGFSQGTMLAFAGFSRNKTLASQIKTYIAFAPVSTLKYMESPLKFLAPLVENRRLVRYFEDFGDFLPSDFVMQWIARHACNSELSYLCADFMFLVAGQDAKQLNRTRLPVYLSHTPAGTSWKNMVHYGQQVMSGKFQMYDYGSAADNIAKYGQDTPPMYNAGDMDVKVAIFQGGNDLLADPVDVKMLLPQLKKLVAHVFIQTFEHLDFIWAMDATDFVYKKAIKIIKQLS